MKPWVSIAVVVASLWNMPVRAQDASIGLFDLSGQTQLSVKRSDCAAVVQLNFEATIDEPLVLLRFVHMPLPAACPTDLQEPLAVVVRDDEQLSPTGSDIVIRNRPLAISAFLPEAACATDDGAEDNVRLCAQLHVPGELTARAVAGRDLRYDTIVPSAPVIDDVEVADGALTAVLADNSTDDDVVRFAVQVRRCDAGGEGEGEGEGEGNSEVPSLCDATTDYVETADLVVSGLVNDKQHEVRAVNIDDVGNRSEPSTAVLATPVGDLGFLARYEGQETAWSCDPSGCGSSGAGLLLLPLIFRRRRKRSSVMALTVLCVLATTHARAEVTTDAEKKYWQGIGRDTLSLSVSSYTPGIDQPGQFQAYRCSFGANPLLRIGMADDMHVWDGFGSLAVHIGGDATQANGFAQPLGSAGSNECQSPTKTKVQMTLVTASLGLTYAFDPLLDAWTVPFVPYVRGGLLGTAYAFTRAGSYDGGGVNPVGLRLGYEGALGMLVALDWLDLINPFTPLSTQRARVDGVLDHTFGFVEASYQQIDTFGQPGLPLTPVDTLIKTGLPLVWRAGLAVELL
jgi:hypothetical protein